MSIEIETGATQTDKPLLLYQNVFEDGTVTVASETADGLGLNAVEDTTFDFWTPSIANSGIAVDYGSAVQCDCFGVAAHTAGTAGTTIYVQSSNDGVTYTNRSIVSPLTDETIVSIFPAVSARYWRVLQGDAVCSIGVLKLGKRLVIPDGVISGGVAINHANRYELLTNMSVKGQFLGTRIKMIGAETNIDFGLMDTDFVDNDMAVFEHHFNSGRTFFYAGSPSEWPEDYGYCWRSGDELRPTRDEGGVLSQVSMDVACYAEQ